MINDQIFIAVLMGVILGAVFGFLFGRLHPRKTILKIAYYQGRLDEIEDKPDRWDKD